MSLLPFHLMHLLIAFVVAVACVDLVRHRIPNLLTLPAAGAALAAHAATAGVDGLLGAGGGLALGLLMFLPFYLAGGFGAGDVKAMAAIGAFMGPTGAVIAAACTLVVGALAGVIILIATGRLGTTIARWRLTLMLARAADWRKNQ